jgi:hypothetical protein
MALEIYGECQHGRWSAAEFVSSAPPADLAAPFSGAHDGSATAGGGGWSADLAGPRRAPAARAYCARASAVFVDLTGRDGGRDPSALRPGRLQADGDLAVRTETPETIEVREGKDDVAKPVVIGRENPGASQRAPRRVRFDDGGEMALAVATRGGEWPRRRTATASAADPKSPPPWVLARLIPDDLAA